MNWKEYNMYHGTDRYLGHVTQTYVVKAVRAFGHFGLKLNKPVMDIWNFTSKKEAMGTIRKLKETPAYSKVWMEIK